MPIFSVKITKAHHVTKQNSKHSSCYLYPCFLRFFFKLALSNSENSAWAAGTFWQKAIGYQKYKFIMCVKTCVFIFSHNTGGKTIRKKGIYSSAPHHSSLWWQHYNNPNKGIAYVNVSDMKVRTNAYFNSTKEFLMWSPNIKIRSLGLFSASISTELFDFLCGGRKLGKKYVWPSPILACTYLLFYVVHEAHILELKLLFVLVTQRRRHEEAHTNLKCKGDGFIFHTWILSSIVVRTLPFLLTSCLA